MEQVENVTRHRPVLLQEVENGLSFEAQPPASRTPMLLDCTLGGAGHSEALLLKYSNLFLIGLDRDPRAIQRASDRLRPFSDRMLLFVDNFANIASLLSTIEERYAEKCGVAPNGSGQSNGSGLSFDRILLDLGISSDQLDDEERGFSFQQESPLDMRMSQEQELMAADIVNEYPVDELKRIFFAGGVGSESGKIARAIVNGRPYRNTLELAEVIVKATRVSTARRRERGAGSKHPATVPFQALRIAVNDELSSLETFLASAVDLLFPRGRLAVISFHSLEDQVVARRMREWERGAATPLRLPVPENLRGYGRLLTGKAIRASADEVRENPRARSAQLRVFERWGEGGRDGSRKPEILQQRRKAG